ncbi:adenylate/guanylate cyclase domain-containing protein, partial [Chelatococcus reniformis]|uniref:adenylate/guanylate cyclase domain-containing protein n=1 Tax=Chelatococcus reniformis TaxID=1494448 RepID=UPI00166A52C1
VPVEIVRRILDDGRFAGRSAARQEVTALFTDIADFTTISERIAPEEVVAMLSAYFDRIHQVVLANDGVLIQFLGDSVFALWNAPTADARHAEHACRCALDLVAEIDAFNREQQQQGLPSFHTRIGIHTGPAVVGSVGAETRLQYTAMGDTINLASRLEGINKTYGTAILVSQTTA